MIKKILDNKIFKIIYGIIKWVFIAGIVLYLSFTLVQRFSNNSSIFGFRIFNIASASMEPVYEVGDAIVVKNIDTSSLKIGDDITYMGKSGDFAGKIVTHRLIRIEKNSNGTDNYVTQGVANQAEDPAIEASQIYGKCVKKMSIVSWISKVIRNKIGFFFLVFVPLVLVIFLEIADTIVESREEKKRKKGKKDEFDTEEII